ncbi:hypothetical protein EVJ58_g10081 [Rhodofomes roseus]|uniref:Uncharacterized protein n=1 Tax=Rhodofomes roseus TaxID=34475 RepID=A0A4Y9XUV5_9APHY|nr:hypothetical protein EVJ58_g10081 [Rhodofomes roseus]
MNITGVASRKRQPSHYARPDIAGMTGGELEFSTLSRSSSPLLSPLCLPLPAHVVHDLARYVLLHDASSVNAART